MTVMVTPIVLHLERIVGAPLVGAHKGTVAMLSIG